MTDLNTNSASKCLRMIKLLLYEISKRSVQHDQDEIHKKEVQNQDRIFEGSLLNVPLFVFFQTQKIEIS